MVPGYWRSSNPTRSVGTVERMGVDQLHAFIRIQLEADRHCDRGDIPICSSFPRQAAEHRYIGRPADCGQGA